jgi:hypothetical protein
MFGGVGLLIFLYGLRAMFAPDSAFIYVSLHALSVAMAVTAAVVVHKYRYARRAARHG